MNKRQTMSKEEIVDDLELYAVGRLLKSRVWITVQELQSYIDAIEALEEPCKDCVSRAEVEQKLFEIIDMYDNGECLVYEDESQTKIIKGGKIDQENRRVLSKWEAVQFVINKLPSVTPSNT